MIIFPTFSTFLVEARTQPQRQLGMVDGCGWAAISKDHGDGWNPSHDGDDLGMVKWGLPLYHMFCFFSPVFRATKNHEHHYLV